ncbi:MAG: phosphate ABC transporter substrate-binding protein [Gammaproteobacteria bacterium]|nr:phosphate ABC transporter substrate-binding protein [Gammaproteobacteria bacterium]MDP2142469.1 phosphate ABC transporter substrate-binding protein [Gammaproteobacteria bacterium]MDP2346472.1 phosphate ABC transporter substrate-binding protein [Gammaproteobacteria bacterium]
MTTKRTGIVTLFIHLVVVAMFLQAAYAAENDNESIGDDIVVVVSRLNPVRDLTRTQVEDIFLGRTQQFPNGQRAVPIDQAERSTIRERFNEEVLARTSAQVRSHWSRILFTGRGQPPRSVTSSEEVLRVLATQVQGIGYIERRLVDDSVVVVFE